jgi:hypothetical protein
MPKGQLIITRPAERDLALLWAYLAEEGVPEAGDWLLELRAPPRADARRYARNGARTA